MTGRLLLVSNRLPVSVHADEHRLVPSTGGLATGLSSLCSEDGTRWIGWSGCPIESCDACSALAPEFERRGLVPVSLTTDEIRGYYEEAANAVLWPLFHSLLGELPLQFGGLEELRRVNGKFAAEVVARYRPGDAVWVHDYHLALVPALVRSRIPDAKIGFFLHIPFPPPEIFCILPWRAEFLRGLLGADLVGFHTAAYEANFKRALHSVLGSNATAGTGRTCRTGVFPMGIDAVAWAERSTRDDVVRLTHRLRDEAGGRRLLVGVDRLDYTKGIPRRIAAVERLFATGLTPPDDVRFLQIAVPSRGNVGSYLAIRRRTDELVGHINGLYSTFGAVPIHNAYRTAFPAELAALYCAADVMLVTPLIDGMNLVAKEFVASRTDHDGVLVLSEFAGAAEQLDGAILVNPYDLDAVARAIARALQMPQAERRARMRRLRAQVITWDVNRWVSSFLHDLGAAASVRAHQPESEPQVRGREPSLMGRR